MPWERVTTSNCPGLSNAPYHRASIKHSISCPNSQLVGLLCLCIESVDCDILGVDFFCLYYRPRAADIEKDEKEV